ncbi:unnamed protein product [Rotaria sordida]|uniref:Integrase catalytic domain-containing protein n=1 Tax=Rotaria sordida TaxID=392033 RepID=A0A814B1N2_9BILA|nr:unnamed protein product [Rotaria sordida]
MLNSYFKLIGIKYILISAYHSWSSGVIERFNHLFDGMIAKYVADNTINKWDQYVDRALFVLLRHEVNSELHYGMNNNSMIIPGFFIHSADMKENIRLSRIAGT